MDDLRAALAVAREAATASLYLIGDGEPVEDAMMRVRYLLAAAEAMVAPPAAKAKPFKSRPAPMAGTLYSRRVG